MAATLSERQPMTVRGKALLEDELRRLIQEERPAVIKAIEEARGHGDISENADYDAAKERQAWIEARIGEIQNKIINAEVIDPSGLRSDTIIFGAHVDLLDIETDEKTRYQIVGIDEADVKQGKISVFSPLARTLIGKRKSDVVELKTPKGEREFKVLGFHFE